MISHGAPWCIALVTCHGTTWLARRGREKRFRCYNNCVNWSQHGGDPVKTSITCGGSMSQVYNPSPNKCTIHLYMIQCLVTTCWGSSQNKHNMWRIQSPVTTCGGSSQNKHNICMIQCTVTTCWGSS